MNRDDGYRLLAGKCKAYCEAIVAADPQAGWRLVRGHYHDPLWPKPRGHWWLESPDGVIYDPTREQFPTAGSFPDAYVEFDGMCECAECGKSVREEDADIDGNYAFCSHQCHGRFVGVF